MWRPYSRVGTLGEDDFLGRRGLGTGIEWRSRLAGMLFWGLGNDADHAQWSIKNIRREGVH